MAMRLILISAVILVLQCVTYASARSRRVLASPDIPLTAFSCNGRPVGYYADLETNCQVYHMCEEGERQSSYRCPNTTLFHQRMLVCAHWYQVNCSRSEEDYSANLLIGQRDQPFIPGYFTGLGEDGVEVVSNNDLQPLTNRRQGDYFTSTAREVGEELQIASSGSLFSGRGENSIPQREGKVRPTTASSVTSRPTNVSFRSTIETPSSDPQLARTQPMTSPPPSTTRSFLKARKPSLELEPPLTGAGGETNTLELRLEDPRRAFFIPEDNSAPPPEPQPILVRIRVRGRDHPPRDSGAASKDCPACHPMFLLDKVNCSPCLRIS